jgi:hypothetical protein
MIVLPECLHVFIYNDVSFLKANLLLSLSSGQSVGVGILAFNFQFLYSKLSFTSLFFSKKSFA